MNRFRIPNLKCSLWNQQALTCDDGMGARIIDTVAQIFRIVSIIFEWMIVIESGFNGKPFRCVFSSVLNWPVWARKLQGYGCRHPVTINPLHTNR